MTIVYFIIALGLLIFIHELGHFIIAKRSGIFVEAFSLGFGPRIFGLKRQGTDYRISLLPLGGYVKMRGEDPSDEKAADPQSFSAKSVWTRTKVVAFGPVMNLLLCVALMPLVFMLGRPEPVFFKEKPVIIALKDSSPAKDAGLKAGDRIVSVDGKGTGTWEDVLNKVIVSANNNVDITVEREGKLIEKSVRVGEMPELRGGYAGFEPMLFIGNEATIDGVKPGGPASAAGIKRGDKVLSFAGKRVGDWMELADRVNENGGSPAPVVVERAGEKVTIWITPAFDKEFNRWLIGISKDRRSGVPMTVVRYGFWGSIKEGTKENVKLAGLTFDVLGRLVTLRLSYKVLGGPIIIAKASAAAAASGLSDFIYFLAFLSLQLAILNFLPIPVLDGGHLFFFGIEAARGKPVGLKARAVADQIGFAVLISLMLLVTYNDMNNLWGIGEFIKKIF